MQFENSDGTLYARFIGVFDMMNGVLYVFLSILLPLVILWLYILCMRRMCRYYFVLCLVDGHSLTHTRNITHNAQALL